MTCMTRMTCMTCITIYGIIFEHFMKTIAMNKVIISLLFLFATYILSAQENRAEILQDLEKGQPSAPAVNQDIKTNATLTSATRLFGDKGDLTTVIMVIPNGSTVEVLGSDSTYYKIRFEDYEGFILRRHAVLNDTPVAAAPEPEEDEPLPQAEEQELVTAQQPEQEQKVSRFTYLESKYGTNMAARLMAGKIWKGMNSEMITDSWGKPPRINRVISGNIVKEEWIYTNSWLYLEDDILIEWGPVRK